MRYVLGIALILVGLVTAMQVTAVQNQPLAFEVATIKPSPPPDPTVAASIGLCHGTDSQLPNFPAGFPVAVPALGRCRILRFTLRGIVAVAYPSPASTLTVNDRITGGPTWASQDEYDIEAKADHVGSATNAQLLSMLRQLLADRFKLKFHTEPKEVKGFALTVTKGGPNLRPGTGEPQGFMFGGGRISATNAFMPTFARTLSTIVKAPVVDQTGLTGGYGFSLSLPSAQDPNGPSIFTILQDELGLRLDSIKMPVEMIVIDHAEKPSEN